MNYKEIIGEVLATVAFFAVILLVYLIGAALCL
jgi:hypothetical protein